MPQDSASASLFDRIMAWIRNLAPGGGRPGSSAPQEEQASRTLPDLDTIDTQDVGGAPSQAMPPPTDHDKPNLAEPIDHSDFDDAAGAYVGGEDYDTISSDPDEVEHVHHAVHGVDDDDDDAADQAIDTSREDRPVDRAPGGEAASQQVTGVPDAYESGEPTERDDATGDTSADHGIPAASLDQADVETADSGPQASPAVDDSPTEAAHFPESAGQMPIGTPDTPHDDGGAIPAGAVRGDGTTHAPEGYPVKAIAASMIYLLPRYPAWASATADICFATEDDAIAAGYRAPGRRGHASHGDTSGE